MERYILFGGIIYYASGGWHDVQGSFADHETAWTTAQQLMEQDKIEWWHIVDLESGEIVGQTERQAY